MHLCSAIKARVVEKDEFDNKGVRVILNLGHTIGHAIEAAAHYKKSYSHGQAVGLGIIAASYISRELKLLSEKDHRRIRDLIKQIKESKQKRAARGEATPNKQGVSDDPLGKLMEHHSERNKRSREHADTEAD